MLFLILAETGDHLQGFFVGGVKLAKARLRHRS